MNSNDNKFDFSGEESELKKLFENLKEKKIKLPDNKKMLSDALERVDETYISHVGENRNILLFLISALVLISAFVFFDYNYYCAKNITSPPLYLLNGSYGYFNENAAPAVNHLSNHKLINDIFLSISIMSFYVSMAITAFFGIVDFILYFKNSVTKNIYICLF